MAQDRNRAGSAREDVRAEGADGTVTGASRSRLHTRLHAEIGVESSPGYEYARGDHGVVVNVIYGGDPYDSYSFTLAASEARELAGQLVAHAEVLEALDGLDPSKCGSSGSAEPESPEGSPNHVR
jgi:hypothetical protein